MSGAVVCQSERVYETKVHDIDELRQRLLHVWHGLEQSLSDDAVDQWRTRLRACVHSSGGHFEHTLYTMLDVAGNILRVHYKCDVSFSLGSVSTLFR